MKNILYIIVLLFITTNIMGQAFDDAIRFNKNELTGTARSLAMANAFSALGGDLSAITLNPASIAVYRSSEFSFTPSISFNSTKANYGEFNQQEDKYSMPFNQIGGVTTYRPLRERETGLISTHFGFTYNRTANYNQNIRINLGEQISSENSLLNVFRDKADGNSPGNLVDYEEMAFNTFLIDTLPGASPFYFNTLEGIDTDNNIFPRDANGIDQEKMIEKRGYAGEYGLTFGANISNKFLLGGSLNFNSFSYDERSTYREINSYGLTGADKTTYPYDLDYYDKYSALEQDGFGVNLKIGAIFNLHPVRLAASLSSPTFYNIKEKYHFGLNTYYQNGDRFQEKRVADNSNYNYRTPIRFTTGAAFIIGKVGILSIDYELTDHTTSKFSPKSGSSRALDQLNSMIKERYKSTHNLRTGFEYKPIANLALRAGFAYYDSPYKKEYVERSPKQYQYTGGFGIRDKNFYFDLAYSLTQIKSDYFVEEYDLIFDPAVKLENSNHQVAMTFGWKF